jgi:ATP-dependent DNA ligase
LLRRSSKSAWRCGLAARKKLRKRGRERLGLRPLTYIFPSCDGDRVQAYAPRPASSNRAFRRGADWTERYPRVVAAVRSLKVRSVILDGEGIVYNHKGMPSFDLVHSREYDKEVSLAAFDLLELDGADLRKQKLLDRKARLAKLLSKVKDGIEFNEHIEGEGHLIYEHACKQNEKTFRMRAEGLSVG